MDDIFKRVVALDVETTGLNPSLGDRICQIALVRIEGDEITDKFVSLVNPERDIPVAVSIIHGIKNEDVRDAPVFKEIADKVASFIENEILIIHNAPFDISFLKVEFQKSGVKFPDAKLVDTLQMARRFLNLPSNSLRNLASYFNIQFETLHDAENDAIVAYRVFCNIWNLISGKINLEEIIQDANKVGFVEPEEILPPELLKAMKEGEIISVRYINRNGDVSIKKILPKEVISEYNNFYLKVFSYEKNREINLRLDRILEIVENIE